MAGKNLERCLEGFQINQEKKNLLATLQRFRSPFTLKGRRYIKYDALPSIFPWSVSSPNKKSPRKRQNVVEMPSSCPTMDNLETNENNKGDSQDKEIADLRAQIAALQEENLILQEPNKDLTKSLDEQLRNQFGRLKFKESDSDIY